MNKKRSCSSLIRHPSSFQGGGVEAVWTPKRILLLALGVAVFLGSYLIYASRLGGVDGLPTLPEKYWPRPAGPLGPIPKRRQTLIAKKLEEAFGKSCPEG